MSVARVGVLQFPGLNCEAETLRALAWIGVPGVLVRWNEPPSALRACAGFVIPGGFSYQDRVRAGAIAAKSPLLQELAQQAQAGKPVLGLCNGAQILVEAGLAPGLSPGRVDAGLARNRIAGWEGYHACWVFVQAPGGNRCFFTEGMDAPWPVPVAHGEGRFVLGGPEVEDAVRQRGAVALTYCTPEGEPATRYPDNPNGSPGAVAGLAGLQGQVLAFMPHPERAARLWHVPEDLPGPWGQRRRAARTSAALQQDGPGMQLLRAFERLAAGGNLVTELVLLVSNRGVDLVAMSAAAALRGPCGLGGRLVDLRRDDGYAIAVDATPDLAAWEHACTARADWFNPNKHRYAFYEAAPGAFAAARGQGGWPAPWLTRRVGSDRPDLASGQLRDELGAWLALAEAADAHAVSLIAWQLDHPVADLPRGHWPASAAGLLRVQLWTLVLRATSAEAAQSMAEEAAITRSRTQGLLIHPHLQGWAWLESAGRRRQGGAH